jgi:hypothetical protein
VNFETRFNGTYAKVASDVASYCYGRLVSAALGRFVRGVRLQPKSKTNTRLRRSLRIIQCVCCRTCSTQRDRRRRGRIVPIRVHPAQICAQLDILTKQPPRWIKPHDPSSQRHKSRFSFLCLTVQACHPSPRRHRNLRDRVSDRKQRLESL